MQTVRWNRWLLALGARLSGALLMGLMTLGVLATTSFIGHAQIWGIKGPDGSYNVPRIWKLFWFREDGSGIFFVGDIQHGGGPAKVDGLAYAPTHGLLAFEMDGSLYEYTGPNSRLVRIDPQTAQVTVIGNWLTGRSIVGAAFDASENLWAIDSRQDELLRIDPNTGQVLQSVPITVQGNRVDLNQATLDIAFDITGQAYINDYIAQPPYGTRFYLLDLNTGAATLVHTDQNPVPGSEIWGTVGPGIVGMAFSRAAPPDRLFVEECNHYDEIAYYDINSSWNRVYIYDVLSDNRPGGYNSGPGDLASFMGCLTHSGDVDQNGCVDDADLLAVLFAFGASGTDLGREDANCDGVVDDADLLAVLFNFGSGC